VDSRLLTRGVKCLSSTLGALELKQAGDGGQNGERTESAQDWAGEYKSGRQ
jgi:hypothetical protein